MKIMKKLNDKAGKKLSKLIGESAIKLGDYQAGSMIFMIDEPQMPEEIIAERKNK